MNKDHITILTRAFARQSRTHESYSVYRARSRAEILKDQSAALISESAANCAAEVRLIAETKATINESRRQMAHVGGALARCVQSLG